MENVIHGVFDKGDKGVTGSGGYMEIMLTKCPHRYYYLEGKKSEVKLDFAIAAEMYTAAYEAASKEGLSCAIRYKWMAMRCIEYDGIYTEMLKDQAAAGGKGCKFVNSSTIMMHYTLEKVHIPDNILTKAKNKIPTGFPYTLVSWDKVDNTIKFLHVAAFSIDTEPAIDRSYIVFDDGKMIQQPYNPDPELILDKWMLTDQRFSTFDRSTSIRRSIRVRYLNIPKPLRLCMNKKSVWEKYVAPRIGNRNIGLLYADFVKSVSA